ncbi:peptidoglycan-binding domain-containing protein [Hoeflea sp. CAU 1731]
MSEAGFIRRMAGSIGETITRYPSLAAGTVAFAVAFGFVTINATQFQPGEHPAPFFDTRKPPVQKLVANSDDIPVPVRKVATYRIEQQDPVRTASIPTPRPQLDNPISEMQTALGRLGLYEGEPDGILGPQTRHAIMAYQKLASLDATGKVSDELLVHARIRSLTTVATPRPKPAAQIATNATPAVKPRATTIEETIEATGEKTGQVARATLDPAPVPAASSDLVKNIQTGLSKLAYADIEIDGVAGQETTKAIRDFQKHYNLPVTGAPDEIVLMKLREIGAL